MENNICFTSRIRYVSPEEFRKFASTVGKNKSVNYPWTVNESVLADAAYTTGVLDCTVCGFTDGQKVLLSHICPTNLRNKDFNSIVDYIKNKIDVTNKNLQGFILGSRNENQDSIMVFNKFLDFMNRYKIPFSQFKGGNDEYSVAYLSSKDEWLITNSRFPAKKDLNSLFESIKISELDEIV